MTDRRQSVPARPVTGNQITEIFKQAEPVCSDIHLRFARVHVDELHEEDSHHARHGDLRAHAIVHAEIQAISHPCSPFVMRRREQDLQWCQQIALWREQAPPKAGPLFPQRMRPKAAIFETAPSEYCSARSQCCPLTLARLAKVWTLRADSAVPENPMERVLPREEVMSYESFDEPLLPIHRFVGRLIGNGFATIIVISASLAIGVWGYEHFEQMSLVDAFLNAAMILGGMGPVDQLNTEVGKIFAGCYALFSGIVILFSATLLLAPVAHRVLHAFHLADEG